jgi:hypothetical protein
LCELFLASGFDLSPSIDNIHTQSRFVNRPQKDFF